jgi:flagellin FlaB
MKKADKLVCTRIVLRKDESGRTGLETAIIMIAFVTVASVFAYSILSAGLFITEKDKGTIHGGLEQARSNMEEIGAIIATSTDNRTVATLCLAVRLAVSGRAIDFTPNDGSGNNRVVISISSQRFFYNNIKWFCTSVGQGNYNYLLEPGEQFDITLDMEDLGGGFMNPQLGPYDTFIIQIKPGSGATLTAERSLPVQVTPVISLL